MCTGSANRLCKLKRAIIQIRITDNVLYAIPMCQSLYKINFFNEFLLQHCEADYIILPTL